MLRHQGDISAQINRRYITLGQVQAPKDLLAVPGRTVATHLPIHGPLCLPCKNFNYLWKRVLSPVFLKCDREELLHAIPENFSSSLKTYHKKDLPVILALWHVWNKNTEQVKVKNTRKIHECHNPMQFNLMDLGYDLQEEERLVNLTFFNKKKVLGRQKDPLKRSLKNMLACLVGVLCPEFLHIHSWSNKEFYGTHVEFLYRTHVEFFYHFAA